MGGPRLTWAACAGLLFSAACGGRRPPPVAAPESKRAGATRVRVLETADRKPPPADVVAERITPAFASDENALPAYPAYALAAGCQEGIVAIRLYVGDDGNVATVAYVPGRPIADDACHSAFWAATSGAVRTWRFAPAFRQTPRPGPDDDGDGRPDFTRWEQAATAIYVDLEFAFRVVDGRGEVLPR